MHQRTRRVDVRVRTTDRGHVLLTDEGDIHAEEVARIERNRHLGIACVDVVRGHLVLTDTGRRHR